MFHGVYNNEIRDREMIRTRLARGDTLEGDWKKEEKTAPMSLVSKLLGAQWACLPQQQKDFFVAKSRQETRLHGEMYPWYKYGSSKQSNEEKEALVNANIPGYLNMEDVAREYHALVRANNLRVVQPFTQADGLASYNVPHLYDQILCDPSECKTKRARTAGYQTRKALKAKNRQSPGSSTANPSSSPVSEQRQMGQLPPVGTQGQGAFPVASSATNNYVQPLEQQNGWANNWQPQPQHQQPQPQFAGGEQQVAGGPANGLDLDDPVLRDFIFEQQWPADFQMPAYDATFGQPSAPIPGAAPVVNPPAQMPVAQPLSFIQPAEPANDGGFGATGNNFNIDPAIMEQINRMDSDPTFDLNHDYTADLNNFNFDIDSDLPAPAGQQPSAGSEPMQPNAFQNEQYPAQQPSPSPRDLEADMIRFMEAPIDSETEDLFQQVNNGQHQPSGPADNGTMVSQNQQVPQPGHEGGVNNEAPAEKATNDDEGSSVDDGYDSVFDCSSDDDSSSDYDDDDLFGDKVVEKKKAKAQQPKLTLPTPAPKLTLPPARRAPGGLTLPQ
ncbi:hypothetical protein F5Y04DRAFT_292571 [Hypomontagnella monticulosa]|nr:hypothetical protein F5Y04DRAFT_292571 [Hypomontagnella monticulosa]